jgi:hypothetical protein
MNNKQLGQTLALLSLVSQALGFALLGHSWRSKTQTTVEAK